MAGHIEEADLRVIRGGDLLLGIQRLGHGPLHVGLARADPDFAEEDIVESDRVLPLHGHGVGLAVRLQGRKVDPPLSVGTSFGGAALAGKLNRDFLSCRRRSPNPNQFLLLQDHVVAKDLG